ncbi:MAG: hypothetical protein ACR2HR_09605 [Euzebya sp.]
MYLDSDDARSDFFLAAAVYVIGPTLIALLLDALPVGLAGGSLGTVILIAEPLITIAAMPLFLLRYRENSLAGLWGGGAGSLALGFGLASVFAVALGVGEVLAGGPVAQLPELVPVAILIVVVVRWLSLSVLAIFLFRRAEYAFRPISESQSTLVRQAGLACVGTALVATVLLLLADLPVWALLPAAGLVGLFFLAERRLPQSGMGERWWVWAPVITLALGPLEIFSIFFDGSNFLVSAQQAGGVALFGLVAVMALHNRRGGALVIGMSIGFMIANLLALAGGTRYFV